MLGTELTRGTCGTRKEQAGAIVLVRRRIRWDVS